jgi:hypothetical protein
MILNNFIPMWKTVKQNNSISLVLNTENCIKTDIIYI